MSGSCPVCYESFNESQPRKLNNCGDIICSSCIQAELGADDNTYYCPECGTPHTGSLLSEISSELSPDLIISSISLSNDEESAANTRESESAILFSNSGASSGYSSNSASENEADLPENGHINGRKAVSSVPRKSCSISGCKYKAVYPHKYCLKHSHKRRKSIVEVEMIAQDMLNNHDLRYFSVGKAGKKITQMDHTDKSLSNSTAPHVLLSKFKAQQRIELGEALDLILRAKAILSREPNILRLDAPVVVVGDIHGQFFDLLKIFDLITASEPKQFASDESASSTADNNGPINEESDKMKGKVFLFLGDYVDRGYYSCEVMLYLLSLKLQYPENIWLLRGNHECASVSGHFGFKEECKTKYGVNIYYSFLLLFQTMPLAAVISTSFGNMYACHGGLSPSLETLESIESIDRLVEPEQNADLMDIVWSDPISDEGIEHMSQQEYESFLNIEWRPNPARGCSYFYGYKAVKSFLRRNDLVCLVRAHEVQEEGYRKHFDPEIMEKKVRSLNKKLEKANTMDAGRLSEGSVGGGGGGGGGLNEDSQAPTVEPQESVNDNGSATKNSLVIQISTPSSSSKAHLSQNLTTPVKYDDSKKWDLKTHPTDNFPPVITIFSAPNYCSRYQNKGAILFIDQSMSNCRFQLYDCVDHPTPHVVESQNSNLIQAILSTCPYMPTSFRNFVRLAVELGYDDYLLSSADSNPEDAPVPAIVSNVLSLSSDSSDSTLLQSIGSTNNLHVSSGSVGVHESARAADVAGLKDAATSIPPLSSSSSSSSSLKGSSLAEIPCLLPVAPIVVCTKKDSPKTISLFRLFPSVDSSDSSGSDNENESVHQNSTGSVQTKASHSLASQPSRGILKSPPLSVSQDQNGYKRFSFSGLKTSADLTPVEGINISKFGTFQDGNQIESSIGDKSLKSAGVKAASVSFCSDVQNALEGHNFPELVSSPVSVKHRNSIIGNGVNGAMTSGSGGNTNTEAKRRKSVKGTHHHANPRGSIYYQALASDSINEVHPERIPDFIQRNFKNIYEESSKRVFQYTLFKLSHEEMPAISVSDLKLRFENNCLPYYEPKANQDVPIGEIIRETDRCTEIAALQNKFGGPGRAKFSPSTKYSPDSIKLRSRTDYHPQSEGKQSAQMKRSIGFRGNTDSTQLDTNNKATGRMGGMLRTKSNNDCLITTTQQPSSSSSSSSIANEKLLKGPPQAGRPRSYSHELIYDSNNFFGPNIITHGAAAASRLSLRESDEVLYLDEESTKDGQPDDKTFPLVVDSSHKEDNSTVEEGNDSSSDFSKLERKSSKSSKAKASITRRHSISNPIKEIVHKFEGNMNLFHRDFRNEHLHIGSVSNIDISSPTNGLDFVLSDNGDVNKLPDSILFSQSEIMGLRLMFSLFDRSGSCTIGYEDLVAYAEETGDIMAIRDAATALEILDIDGDGKIGLLDFIHFARRLKKIHQGTR